MSDLVTVGNFFDRIGAEIAQGVLDAEDIESYVRADDMGGMRPSLLTATGGAWLLVRAEDAERATELLGAESPDAATPDAEATEH